MIVLHCAGAAVQLVAAADMHVFFICGRNINVSVLIFKTLQILRTSGLYYITLRSFIQLFVIWNSGREQLLVTEILVNFRCSFICLIWVYFFLFFSRVVKLVVDKLLSLYFNIYFIILLWVQSTINLIDFKIC